MKALILLACLAAVAAPQSQTTKRVKSTASAQLSERSGAPVVRFGGKEWPIEVSDLRIDAESCEEPVARQNCAKGEAGGCALCIREWQAVAWDEPREVFYLAASTGASQNRPWSIFGYDMRNNKLTAIGEYWGGGFDGSGSVSPTGQYLAYVQYASSGACGSFSSLAIIDTKSRTTRTFPPPVTGDDEKALITAIRWPSGSNIEYDARVYRETECRSGIGATRMMTARLDLTAASQ